MCIPILECKNQVSILLVHSFRHMQRQKTRKSTKDSTSLSSWQLVSLSFPYQSKLNPSSIHPLCVNGINFRNKKAGKKRKWRYVLVHARYTNIPNMYITCRDRSRRFSRYTSNFLFKPDVPRWFLLSRKALGERPRHKRLRKIGLWLRNSP